jgi:hypothetical protein
VKVGDDWVEIMDSAQRCDLIFFVWSLHSHRNVWSCSTSRPGK